MQVFEYNKQQSQTMSQWKLPLIDTKKQTNEQEDYNFINKDKKKSRQESRALSVIDQLKRKIEQQKKQIQNRNTTIMGLQRNFQSLSGIVKHEKTQNAALKAELETYKQNSQTGDNKAKELHQKCIVLENENRFLKEELQNAKKSHGQCHKKVTECQSLSSHVMSMEKTIERLEQKMVKMEENKNRMELELSNLRGEEKSKRELNIRIIDLEEQLRKTLDHNNALHDRLKINDDELSALKKTHKQGQEKHHQMQKKVKDSEVQRYQLEKQVQKMSNQIKFLKQQLDTSNKKMSSKDIHTMIRQEQGQKLKQELRLITIKYQSGLLQIGSLKQSLEKSEKACANVVDLLKIAEDQLSITRGQYQRMQKEARLIEQAQFAEAEKLKQHALELNNRLSQYQGRNDGLTQKLMRQSQNSINAATKLKEVSCQLEEINLKVKNQHEKYAKYMIVITEKEERGLKVVITDQEEILKMKAGREEIIARYEQDCLKKKQIIQELSLTNANMKQYIGSLQSEANQSAKENAEKSKQVKSLSQKVKQLEGEQAKLAEILSQQKKRTQSLLRQSEQLSIHSQKMIEESQRKIEQQKQQQKKQSLKYQKMLEQYQAEQEELKKLMRHQKQSLSILSKEKEEEIQMLIRQKESQIQNERKNNKLLWSDNKKLKDMENRLRQEAENQIKQLQEQKDQELNRLKADLETKYHKELAVSHQLHNQQESNSSQLKKILREKAEQVKTLTQNYGKVKNQLEFYKNRIKELEGVVSRAQKNHKQQLTVLEREVKADKQIIAVLDKKNTQLALIKQETEKKNQQKIQHLSQQLQYLKSKYEGQKIEQKIMLVNQSIMQFESSLKAVSNTLSCNYCVEPVKQCVRIRECGHIFCKKCKAGYQPNCGECQKSGVILPDKMIDQTISKTDYMKILLETVKDDLNKISL